jgi:diguanylate cyclase (GGDEF)-like protein
MRRHRVLVVDDQPANVRVMGEVLRDHYDVYFATTGAKALEVALVNEVDLILLDVVLPDLDGFEVCARLKSDDRTKDIPVIFVTAREEVSDEARGFDAGGVDYITKPIRPPVVIARVRNHLELKHARDLLESLASIDGLTGIANRRRFDDCLEREWKRCARDGTPFSLALADVDHFKQYNDVHGHARGDDCLRTLARSLASLTRRPADLAARYGGEEFGLIFPGTEAHGMCALMRDLVERAPVSVSAGAVTLVPGLDDSPQFALTTADELLYEAKANGRGQIRYVDLITGARVRISAETLERA